MQTESLLEGLGLTKTEARVYVCLLERSPLAAGAIADLTGTSRSSVYLILRSLVDKGLIDAGAGYSSRFQPSAPDVAFAGLLERGREELRERERSVQTALPDLMRRFETSAGGDGELVEILRTPKLVGDRFDRLHAASERAIDIIVRRPIQVGGSNQPELDALARGVRVRAVYDHALMAHPTVVENIGVWVAAGEDARVFHDDLPMKWAVFDGHTVLMPLVAPGVGGVVALIVRSRELAGALGLLFDTLWAASAPVHPARATVGGDHGA
ncbi:TrmB family transcriptional regulator [Jiangella alkaliphila]|uniref:Sugar-specific transcriptional regulator TrmB n=1 Tax=Jiangella alkaliphila TaxID=419479 RepID=A0A1H2KU70_9ACTN|nr:helix-turn-helix domain-containing protein [Jiangella alkaliphila]SDU72287.1 Sugar-specific transcriptional regulator TrmB [Jiangella alkaliphila]